MNKFKTMEAFYYRYFFDKVLKTWYELMDKTM